MSVTARGVGEGHRRASDEAGVHVAHHRVQFRLLGPVEVAGTRGVRPIGGPKQRAVLASLLLRARTPVPAERVIADVWAERPPASARTSLHGYVSNLRQVLGADRIEHRSGAYVLHAGGDEIDAERFVALADRAATVSPAQPSARAALLIEALDLWRGPALEDLATQPPFAAEAVRLDELRAAAREDLLSAQLTTGAHGAVIADAETLVAADPLRERPWELLITALYLEGRQADALAAFQRARTVLRAELGVEPSPRLQRVHTAVLHQQLALQMLLPALRSYRLRARIGHEGDVTRYVADRPTSARRVEIAVLGRTVANDPAFVRRFDAEARAVHALTHPRLTVPVDWWREPDAAFVVTPHVDGTTLADRLTSGPLDGVLVARIVDQLRDALDAAHRRGVAHGALGTDTVVLDAGGGVHLTRFAVGRAPLHDPATIAADRAALAAIATTLGRDSTAAGTVSRNGVGAPEASRGPNPYKGLHAFGEADAADYFGRTAAVERLVARLAPDTRFLAVVGPSGAGSSSLVSAGLIPALRRGAVAGSQQWLIVTMTPGAAPFEDLAAALLSVARESMPGLAARLAGGDVSLGDALEQLLPPDTELLVVVDQFDALYTAADMHVRDALLTAIGDAVQDPGSRLRVVVTLRADHLDRPLRHEAFASLLTTQTEIVPPLTAAEVAEAVTGPARRAGVEVDAALVAQVSRDVTGQPGALPLLQYALTELYERGGARLTLDGYHAVGGLVGALARRADAVLAGLPAVAQDAARRLFLRLVTLDEMAGALRRRMRVAALTSTAADAEADAMRRAIDAFGAARMLTFDRDPRTREATVEVAHEALLTEWGQLRRWIEAARDDLVTEHRLATAAQEWQATDQDPSFLASGHRLDRFDELARGASVVVTPDERAYVDTSLAQRRRRADEDAARRAERARLQRRSLRRLRAMLAVLSGAVLVAAALTVFGMQQRAEARREARIAAARELAAAATANLEVDPQRSLLLATAAVERTAGVDGEAVPAAEDALRRAIGASHLLTSIRGARAPIVWSPAGDVVATGSARADGEVTVRDARDLTVVDTIAAHDGELTGLAFSADGSALATTGTDGRLRVWDMVSGTQVLETGPGGDATVRGPSFSHDGTEIAMAVPDRETVLVADAGTGTVVAEIPTIGTPVDTAISSDGDVAYAIPGTRAALTTFDREAQRVDIITGLDGDVHGVAYQPGGGLIASDVALVRSDTGATVADFAPAQPVAPSWSDDGRRLMTGAGDGAVIVHRVNDGGVNPRERLRLVAPDAGAVLVDAALSPDASTAAAVDDAGHVHAWSIGVGASAEVAHLPGDGRESITHWPGIGWSPDSSRLAVSAGGGDIDVYGSGDWSPGTTLAHGRWANVTRIEWSDDGSLLASVGRRRAKVWDPERGSVEFEVRYGHEIGQVAWSPTGHLAVVGGPRAMVVDGSGTEVARVPAAAPSMWGVAFNHDGTLLALAGDDRNPRLDVWRWRDGELVATSDVGTGSVAFHPTEDRLAVVTPDGAELRTVADDRTAPVPLVGHTAGIDDVTFSPDGGLVATAGSAPDSTVRLWDASSGAEIAVLRGHVDGVDQVRFSPDGRWLASSATADGIRVWALRTDDLLDIARERTTRGLTEAECARYLHGPCPPTRQG